MKDEADPAFRPVGLMPLLVTAVLFAVVGAMAADGIRALWVAAWTLGR